MRTYSKDNFSLHKSGQNVFILVTICGREKTGREDADNDGNGADMTGQHESFNIVWILGWG